MGKKQEKKVNRKEEGRNEEIGREEKGRVKELKERSRLLSENVKRG